MLGLTPASLPAFLAFAVFASSGHAAEPSTRPAWPQRQIISGLVQDQAGQRVHGAIVSIQDARTGMPYSNVTDHPFSDMQIAGEPHLFTHVASGSDGRFYLRGIFPGTYRLVAQSWEDVESVKDLVSTNSEATMLRGVVEDIRVTEDREPPPVVLKPAGTATLHVTFELDDAYVLVSTKPPSDPLLGVLAWNGEFLRNLVGVIHMRSQRATMSGLPEGTLYLCAMPNNRAGGLGTATVNAKGGQVTEASISLIVPDNGPRKLPDRLAAVDALIKRETKTVSDALSRHATFSPGQRGIGEMLDAMDREIALPGGEKVTLRDIATLRAYEDFNRKAEEIAKRKASPLPSY